MTKICPVCEKSSVNFISVIAAVFRSESRCAACGSAVRFGASADGLFLIGALIGFGVGFLVENFVIGGIVAIAFIIGCIFRMSLEPDTTDSVAANGLFRKRIRRQKSRRDQSK